MGDLDNIAKKLWLKASDVRDRLENKRNQNESVYNQLKDDFKLIIDKDTDFSVHFTNSSYSGFATHVGTIISNLDSTKPETQEKLNELTDTYNIMFEGLSRLYTKMEKSLEIQQAVEVKHLSDRSLIKNEIDRIISDAEDRINTDLFLDNPKPLMEIISRLRELSKVADKVTPGTSFEAINNSLETLQENYDIIISNIDSSTSTTKKLERKQLFPGNSDNTETDETDNEDPKLAEWRERKVNSNLVIQEIVVTLLKDMSGLMNSIRDKILSDISSYTNNDQAYKIQEINGSIKELKGKLDYLVSNQNASNAKDNQAAINRFNNEISKKEMEKNTLSASLARYEFFAPEAYTDDMDIAITYVRRYQNALRKITSSISSPPDRKEAMLVRKMLNYAFEEKCKIAITKLFSDLSTFVITRKNTLKQRERSVSNNLLKKTEDSIIALDRLFQDYATQVSFNLDAIHREVVSKIKVGGIASETNYSASVIIYGLKLFRIITSLVAFYVAEKLFADRYKKTAESNDSFIDLRWFTVIFLSFHFIFDVILITVMYFVRRIDPKTVSLALIIDFAFDTFIVTLMLLLSSIWIAHVIQDKRYFAYQTNYPRAVRALKEIMFWLLIKHSIIPYFYLCGPNMTGRIDSKDVETSTEIQKKQKMSSEVKTVVEEAKPPPPPPANTN